MSVIKIAGYIRIDFLSAEFSLCINIVLDAKHIGGETNELAHVLHALVARQERGAVVAKVVVVKSFNVLALRCGVALDNSLVALVGDVLADIILVIGDKDALTVAAILGVELHGGVKGGAGTGEEVKNGGFLFRCHI